MKVSKKRSEGWIFIHKNDLCASKKWQQINCFCENKKQELGLQYRITLMLKSHKVMRPDFEKLMLSFLVSLSLFVIFYFLRKLLAYVVQKPELL